MVSRITTTAPARDPAVRDPAAGPGALGRRRDAYLGAVLLVAALLALSVRVLGIASSPWWFFAANPLALAGAFFSLRACAPWIALAGDVGILQFMGYVSIPLLARAWLGLVGENLEILFEPSPSLVAFALVLGCAAFAMLCAQTSALRAAIINAAIGVTLVLALGITLWAMPPTGSGSSLTLLGLAMAIVALALTAQWAFARRSRWPGAQAWASPLGLALVGTQLFDGVFTYLVVANPLSIAPEGYEERIALSRMLLERFGVGFALIKWALGLMIAQVLAQSRIQAVEWRTALALAVLVAGLGPGLFSAAQLL